MHPVVYHARNLVGLDTIIEKPDSAAWPRFEKAYQALVTRVLAGEVFELPVSACPQLEDQRIPKITAPGDGRAHVQAIRAKVWGGKSVARKS